jgi:hypothetical protein
MVARKHYSLPWAAFDFFFLRLVARDFVARVLLGACAGDAYISFFSVV